MALDPSIPLQIRPTQQLNDPMEQYGRMLSLKNMQAQQQQQQQLAPLIYQQHQLQLSEAQIQQRQMQQQEADQEGTKKAYIEGGGDPEKVGPLLSKYNVSPDGQARFGQSVIAGRAARAKLTTEEAAADEARHDIYLPRLTAFRAKPKEYQEQNWGAFNQQAHQDGGMSDEHYKQLLKQHPELPDDDTLDIYQAGMKGSKREMERQKAQAAIDASQSTTAKNNQAIAKGKTEEARGKLMGTQTPAQYDEAATTAYKNGVPAGEFPAFGQMFDQNGDPIKAQMRTLNRMGMSPAQRDAEDDRADQRRIAQQNADANTLRAKNSGDPNSPQGQRRQQILDAGEQKKWDDLDKAKVAGEKSLTSKRDTEVAKLLKDTGFDTEGQASAALSSAKTSAYSRKQAQKALDAIKGINRKYAPQLQGVQDRYAGGIRARKGNAVDYDVDPDTLAYRERAAAAEPDDPAPAAAPKPAAAAATPPPAPAPQRMRNAAGHEIEYDPKQNAWVDAETRKPVHQ